MSRQFLAYWNRSNMLYAKKQFQGNEKGIYFIYQMNIRNLHHLKCIYVKMLIFKTQNYFLLKIALINKRFILKYKINLSSTLPGTWKMLLFTWELVRTGFLPSLRSSPLSNAAVKK